MISFRSFSPLFRRALLVAAVLPACGLGQVPQELDLRTAILFALDNNFAIRQARERIREQEGLILEVKSQVMPNVSLSAGLNRQANSLTSANASNQNGFAVLQVRQLLYSGGGVRAALDAQQYVRESALLDLETVINDQLLAVRTNFYDVILAREQITVQEQNVALLQEQLQTARDRFAAGAVSNFEVLRAQVELANAQAPLIRSRNNLRIAIDQLRFSLGFDIRAARGDLTGVPEFVGDLSFKPVSVDMAGVIDEARANRPELRRLAKIVAAREAGLTIAKSDRLPDLYANAGYEFRHADFRSMPTSNLDGWTVGLQSSWAIFDGRATRGRVAQALSQQEQARLALDEATLAVEVEVRRAVSALNEATELVDAAAKVVEQAEEALRLANARYGAGTATQLELLAAQVSLTQARDNQLQAGYSYNTAAAALRRAAGQSDVLIAP